MTNINEFEWEEIVNSPEHQAQADARAEEEEVREAYRDRFYEKLAERKKKRLEIEASRFTLGGLLAFVVVYLLHNNGMYWLSLVCLVVSIALSCIACYGWGRFREMVRS